MVIARLVGVGGTSSSSSSSSSSAPHAVWLIGYNVESTRRTASAVMPEWSDEEARLDAGKVGDGDPDVDLDGVLVLDVDADVTVVIPALCRRPGSCWERISTSLPDPDLDPDPRPRVDSTVFPLVPSSMSSSSSPDAPPRPPS